MTTSQFIAKDSKKLDLTERLADQKNLLAKNTGSDFVLMPIYLDELSFII